MKNTINFTADYIARMIVQSPGFKNAVKQKLIKEALERYPPEEREALQKAMNTEEIKARIAAI